MKKLVALVLACLLTMACTLVLAEGTEEQKSFKVGILQYVEHNALDSAKEGFVDCLAENGYVEGDNLEITYLNPSGDNATLQLMASQLADGTYDLILGIATPAVQALAAATSDTPILGTAVTDYESAALVASNEEPGLNISGTSDMNPVELQMELLTKLVPQAKTVAILYTASEVNSEIQAQMAADAASAMGLETITKTVTAVGDVQQAVESIVTQADAIYLPTDNIIASALEVVAGITNAAGIPTICGEENMVKAGGLATYGLNYYKLGYQTGEMALRILVEGADISTMPIEFLAEADIYLNQQTADQIGLTFPEDILAETAEENIIK